jgi:Zn-dependent protease with chaperone function/tellurite resistance protein
MSGREDAMDFFAAQEQARKKTRWLVLLFMLAVVSIVLLVHLFSMLALYLWQIEPFAFGTLALALVTAIYFLRDGWFSSLTDLLLPVIGVLIFYGLIYVAAHYWLMPYPDFRFVDAFRLWNTPWILWVCLFVACSIVATSLYKMWQISRQGGKMIAEQLGGRMIPRNSSDMAERQLSNVVDEMAIAAGIPAPVAYVLPQESGLNAFAAGLSTRDGVIAVTRGLLNTMSRDELQGIIAHETSHIVNGDSRLNMKLLGVLFGIYAFTLIGRKLMKPSDSLASMEAAPKIRVALEAGLHHPIGFLFLLIPLAIALIGSLFSATGSIGLFYGRVIQAIASREREFLADAAAVQFTRNPAGLTSALHKLRTYGSQIHHSQAAAVSHFFFGASDSPDGPWLDGPGATLFATHPPLKERLRRIGNVFLSLSKNEDMEEEEAPVQSIYLAAVRENIPHRMAANPHAAMPVELPGALAAVLAKTPSASLPAAVAMGGIAGEIAPKGVAQAQALLARLPAKLREEAATVAGATGIVCGLLFSSQNDIRQQQEKLLTSAALSGALPVARELYQWLSMQPEQGARYRLVWLDLALPTLRGAAKDECQQLLDLAMALIRADGRLSPSEFAIYNILQSALLPPSERRINKSELRPEQLDGDIASLLALMAYAGHTDLEAAKAAYQTALAASPAGKRLPFPEKKDFSLKTVSSAFSRLALAAPPYRKKILEACAVAAQHDGKITPVENELLRAFAQSLDCPAPLA